MLNSVVYQFDLMSHLVWREFTLRYKRSTLGILWSLVQPLAQLLVLVFLFQKIVPLNIPAYPAFVFSALLPWTWFSSSISSSCGLFLANRDLVRRPDFVPASLGVVNMLSNLLTYVAALPILFVMLAVYEVAITPAIMLLPVLMVLQAMLIVGLGLIVATLNVFYRDVQHVVIVTLSLLFYLTPVFYRPQSVITRYELIYMINPMAILIQAYRSIIFYGSLPPLVPLLFAAVAAASVVGMGAWIYHRQQPYIVDEI